MKNIKRLHHLQRERRRWHRKLKLENSLRSNWATFRQSFDPTILATKALTSCVVWIGDRLLAERAAEL